MHTLRCLGAICVHWSQRLLHNSTPDLKFWQIAEQINQVLYAIDINPWQIAYINPAFERVWGRSRESLYERPLSFLDAVLPADRPRLEAAIALQRDGQTTEEEYRITLPGGETRWILDRAFPIRDEAGQVCRVVGLAEDITEHKGIEAELLHQKEALERVVTAGQSVAAELEVSRLVQSVTDAACELCGAQFGAFFYNVIDKQGERYTLYALSGAPREAFENYPMPRATALFGPTFRGEGTVLIEDVQKDARFGLSEPHFGLPPDHPPVASYLAVPVISRSGTVWGGLFFGHIEAGIFKPSHARMVELLAAQAAIAMDNAQLFEQVERERNTAAESERDYRILAQSIPQMVWVTGADGHLTYTNQRWKEFVGAQLDDVGGDRWSLLLHPDDMEKARERWRRSVLSGEDYEVEYRMRRHDGEYRWQLARGRPIFDAQGAIQRWMGTCTDIDDQKQSQQALWLLSEAGAVLSSSLEFHQTVQNLVDLTVPTLCDWCVVDVVEEGRFKRLAASHIDPEKVALAYEFNEKYPPRLDDETGVPYVFRTGQSQLTREITDEMLEASSHDAEMFQTLSELGLRSAICVPLQTHGETFGVLTLISAESQRLFDESDLMLAEELARRASEAANNARLHQNTQEALTQAQNAMRARDEFLAIVSHELKTPLTPILGWVSILQDIVFAPGENGAVFSEAITNPEQHAESVDMVYKALEIIARNVHAQTQLVNDLLDVSRIVTGKLRLELRPLQLKSVVEAALETVRPTAEARGIQLLFDPTEAGDQVKGDPHRLQQVVWNLASNALKFTPKGGVVKVALATVGSQVEIVVRDTGQGIAPEFLPFIFDRFQQADSSTTRQHGGLGLGLSIVRHLIEMHGGTVAVESDGKNCGSTFRVSLPLLAIIPTPSQLAPQTSEMEDAEFASTRPDINRQLLQDVRILVVEDEADSREMIEASLREFGAQVQTATSAIEGVQRLCAWRPDILLSDIGMPGEDGYSLMRRVRALSEEEGGKTPAVALTAYSRMEDRFKALSVGFQNHLAKPIEPSELAITIASTLGRVAEM